MADVNYVSPGAGAAEALAPEQVAVVAVEVEQGPSNSRRLYAGIDIAAPWDAVWSTLTDYDGLADFIPGQHILLQVASAGAADEACCTSSSVCYCGDCRHDAVATVTQALLLPIAPKH